MKPAAPAYVTRPQLPPLEDFVASLRKIWDSHILTNGGPFHQELESSFCSYLGVAHISLFNNGASALLTATQALDSSGEVITTPYTFVATSHALLWSRTALFGKLRAHGIIARHRLCWHHETSRAPAPAQFAAVGSAAAARAAPRRPGARQPA